MDPRSIITQFQRRGVVLFSDGGQLKSRCAPGALGAADIELIRAHKNELLAFLAAREPEAASHHDGPQRTAGAGPAPLSATQRRLWFIDQMEGSSQYVLPIELELRGGLDVELLERAVRELVRRHEVLRTVFRKDEGDVAQHVLADPPVPFDVRDLRSVAGAERAHAIAGLRAAHLGTPFDLAADVPLRVTLVRLGERDWLAWFAFHHIATDGWSLAIFTREFVALYETLRRGDAHGLAPLDLQYRDFAHWQQAEFERPAFVRQLDYWRRQLDGLPQLHALPLDKPRPHRKGSSAGRLVLPLGAEMTAALKEFGRRHEATPFMVMYAALNVVLAAWSRSDDIVVGTAVAGRTHPSLSGLIGFFANTLVLRARCDLDQSFAGILRECRRVCLDAYDHQQVPFDAVVDALRPVRSDSYTPLFQIVFSLLNIDANVPQVADLDIEPVLSPTVSTGFDLDITATERDGNVTLRWDYDHALFEHASVARMMATFGAVLAQVLRAPERALRDLDLVAPADLAAMAGWNETRQAYPDACVHQLVERQAAATPDRTALIAGTTRLTYRELNGKANALARALQAAGVRCGDIVPVVMHGSAEVPLGFLALMKLGAAFAPLDPAWPEARLLAAMQAVRATVVLDDGAAGGTLPAGVRAFRVAAAPLPLEADLQLPLDAAQPLYVMHTSGSTGAPKGALNQHRGVVNRLSFMNRLCGTGESVVLQTTPHYYDSAFWQYFWPLLHGGRTVLPSFEHGLALHQIADLVQRHGVTVTDLTPALLGLFVDHVAGDAADWRLRHLIVGGEELTPALAARCRTALPGVQLHNFYGASEASIASVSYTLPEAVPVPMPVGRPIDNTTVAVVDQALRPVPVGAVGEILLGGDCVGLGYVGREDETRRAFLDLPAPLFGTRRYYRTGDLGRLRNDGLLEFLGRIDAGVKLRGFRVDLAELQSALEALPGVRQACVVAMDEGASKRLVGYLVPAAGRDVPDEDWLASVRAALAGCLPSYMIPRDLVVLAALPLGGGGKVDRRALPPPVRATTRSAAEPETHEEKLLAGLWAELLNQPSVGRFDNFFELGGHSLLATQLVARVRKQMGIEMPLRVLFRSAHLADLGAWCATAGTRLANVEEE